MEKKKVKGYLVGSSGTIVLNEHTLPNLGQCLQCFAGYQLLTTKIGKHLNCCVNQRTISFLDSRSYALVRREQLSPRAVDCIVKLCASVKGSSITVISTVLEYSMWQGYSAIGRDRAIVCVSIRFDRHFH